ncbi:unnamed protein product [Triticum turgidum subsp. durum]|uniref:Uncharacterized protein n=1 Tax=Triticum turgidum subsp. durum TaxID=4567 RepID=A0A9R0W8L0_TRITD|nr:unnamed protein product [Triticum turgidum subsp. durum]
MSGIDRFERSLRSRWSTINSDCQKWAAVQKAVDKINPSGTNEDDRVSGISYMFIILVLDTLVTEVLTCFVFLVVQHCTKLVQRRDEDNQEGED